MTKPKISLINISKASADAYAVRDSGALAHALDSLLMLSPLCDDLQNNAFHYAAFLANEQKHLPSALRFIQIALETKDISNKDGLARYIVRYARDLPLKGQAINYLKKAIEYAETDEPKEHALLSINEQAKSLSTDGAQIDEHFYVLNSPHATHQTDKVSSDSLLEKLSTQKEINKYRAALMLIIKKRNNKCKTCKSAKKLLNESPSTPKSASLKLMKNPFNHS